MYSQTNELVNAKYAWNFASQVDLLNIFTPCWIIECVLIIAKQLRKTISSTFRFLRN